jgi:hypothetical protein
MGICRCWGIEEGDVGGCGSKGEAFILNHETIPAACPLGNSTLQFVGEELVVTTGNQKIKIGGRAAILTEQVVATG